MSWNDLGTFGTATVGFGLGWIAGFINSMAGGATLLTFPALIYLGLDAKAANATGTVGLWPGSIGGAFGYRRELRKTRRGFWSFLIPSLLGGAVGALLLLTTEPATFRVLVPWLILGATALFAAQKPIARWLKLGVVESHQRPTPRRALGVLTFQFVVSIYGGYFGAGIGVLMLAGLGFLGIDDLHERNGVKNLAATCINGVAAILFAVGSMTSVGENRGIVHWPISIAMAVGSMLGGYWSAGLARRVGPTAVRVVVIFIGVVSGLWALLGSP